MRLVAKDVLSEFRHDFFLTETIACHFGFDDDLFGFEQVIHPARVSTIAGRPLLRSDIRKVEVFVYRVEGVVKSRDLHKTVDKSREFGYLKLDEWERVQRICRN